MDNVGSPGVEMVMDDLSREESLKLLGSQSLGRLAVADHGYYPPHIVPVNFILDGESVLFRSDDGLKFKLSVLSEHSVSFEADSVEPSGQMGWSVVVQGRAELLTDEEAHAVTLGAWLRPLAPGAKEQWVRIVPYTITGRRLRPVPVQPHSDAG